MAEAGPGRAAMTPTPTSCAPHAHIPVEVYRSAADVSSIDRPSCTIRMATPAATSSAAVYRIRWPVTGAVFTTVITTTHMYSEPVPDNSVFLTPVKLAHPKPYNTRNCFRLAETSSVRAILDWLEMAVRGLPVGIMIGKGAAVPNALYLGLQALMEMDAQTAQSELNAYFPGLQYHPNISLIASSHARRSFWIQHITPHISGVMALPNDRSVCTWSAELVQPIICMQVEFTRSNALQVGSKAVDLTNDVPPRLMGLHYTLVIGRYLPQDRQMYLLIPHRVPAREWADLARLIPPCLRTVENDMSVDIVALRQQGFDLDAPYAKATWGLCVNSAGTFKWVAPAEWGGVTLNMQRSEDNKLTAEHGYILYPGNPVPESSDIHQFYSKLDITTLPGTLLTFSPRERLNPCNMYEQDEYHQPISRQQHITWQHSWTKCTMPDFVRSTAISSVDAEDITSCG